MSRIAFVIGCDRTGTHWIARTLAQHPDMTVTLEVVPQLWYSWGMAANRHNIPELFPKLASTYNIALKNCGTEVYLDKAHPNIWLVDQLLERFPKAKFIGTDRNPYATISSMLCHSGVLRDVLLGWIGMTMPNMLVGAHTVNQYFRLSKAQRCAAKWESHHLYLQHLKDVLPKDQLYIHQFERFADEPMEVIGEVQDFLGIDRLIKKVTVIQDAVDKWKHILSEQARKEIDTYFRITARQR